MQATPPQTNRSYGPEGKQYVSKEQSQQRGQRHWLLKTRAGSSVALTMHDDTSDARSVQSQITLDTFLAAFYPDKSEEIRLRAFKPRVAPDAPNNRTEKFGVTREQLGNIEHRQHLKALNSTRGLYFVVNAGGDKDKDIKRFNAWFIERDDISIAEQHQALDRAPLPPSIRIETRKSVHAYWPIEGGCDAQTWREIQCRLIACFHADEANKNKSRVMRLPYFDHLFYEKVTGSIERKRVELVSFNAALRYTAEKMLAAFPPTNQSRLSKTNETVSCERRIHVGARNNKLTSLAGKLRWAGFGEESIYATLLSENQQRCEPPLEADEVRRIARSISRYESGVGPLTNLGGSEIAAAANKKSDDGPPSFLRMADVEPQNVSWLWYPYIALGKFTIIEGDPGIGKSWLTCALACAVSRGQQLHGVEPLTPSNVLMLSAEDGLSDTLRPRLDAVGADVSRVYALNEHFNLDSSGRFKLEEAIIEYSPALVIIDPLFAFTESKVDIHRANESRAVSAPLADLAERYGCAMVAVRHLGKSRGGGHALNAGIGSIDFTAAARSVLLVGRDPDDEGQRAVVQIKNNLAPLGASIGFKVEGDRFDWTGVSDLTAARILASDSDNEGRGRIDEAIDFLRTMLTDGHQPTNDIKSAARQVGISNATLNRAKGRLGVRVKKVGQPGTDRQHWVWQLPTEGAQLLSEDTQEESNEHLRLNC